MKRTCRALALSMIVAAAALCTAGPAAAVVKTETFRMPVTVKGYQVKQDMTLADHPRVDGFITGMKADIVDKNGRPIPISRLMLHHIVFSKLGAKNPQCDQFTAFDEDVKLPGIARSFYAAGEERNVLELPPGYGLPMKKGETWLNTWMLMNHRKKTDRAFVEWTVKYDTNPNLKPVEPYWLDVKNCKADPIFNVPGGGKKGSTYSKSYTFNMPHSGRIVAVGGHVHGGAKDMRITQPACGNRELMKLDPAWGTRRHPFYNVRPVLHEPGPIAVSRYFSSQGYPVAKGQPIRLTANYDNRLPHTRVMGIALAYVTPVPVVNGCGPLPSDVQRLQTTQPHRTKPPKFTVPLVGIGPNGRARDIRKPPGRAVRLRSGAKIRVRNFYFSRPNVIVKRGARLRWNISALGRELHNVTLASGPRGFGSPNRSRGKFVYRFKKRGKYKIFCALHPVTMTEVVTVR